MRRIRFEQVRLRLVLSGLVAVAALAVGDEVRGEIVSTSATVSAIAQERIGGEPASVTSTSDELAPDGSNLPFGATAELSSTDLGGALIAQGAAFSEFMDPARLDQPNPEEFAIEAACNSNGSDVSYFVGSVAIETRRIRFGAGEVDFSTGGSREVSSTIFLSGALLVWVQAGAGELDGLSGEVDITVTRDGDESLFSSTVELSSDGAGGVATTTNGPVTVRAVSVAELGAFGLDAASVETLQAVESGGTLTVLILPEQQHDYTHTVEEDREYVLSATFLASLTNAPGGTGIAAVIGRPFANIAAFVEEGLPGTNGSSLQSSINKAIATQSAGDGGSGTGSGFLCGAFGLEALAMLGSMGLIAGRRRWQSNRILL